MASPTILLIEGDDADTALIVGGLARVVPRERVAVCRGGAAALDFFRRRGEDQPMLALLDLGRSLAAGFEVLRDIRDEPHARLVPVTVLSAADGVEDVRRAAQLGANSFVHKPADTSQLAETLEQLARYWLELNIPPPCCVGH